MLWKNTHKSLKIKEFLLNALYILGYFLINFDLKMISVGIMKNYNTTIYSLEVIIAGIIKTN